MTRDDNDVDDEEKKGANTGQSGSSGKRWHKINNANVKSGHIVVSRGKEENTDVSSHKEEDTSISRGKSGNLDFAQDKEENSVVAHGKEAYTAGLLNSMNLATGM